MSEEEKPVKIPFRVEDLASRSIEFIAKKVEKLSEHVDESLHKLTEMGAALAGIAGGLSFERMIDTGKESLETINKLHKLTGVSADNIAAMRDMFEQSGLSAEQLGTTMTALSKKALAAEEGGKGIVREARAWGVELNKGPVEAYYSLSRAVQQHKIDQAGVSKLTRTSGEALGAQMELLEKGPKELEKMAEAARKLNVHLEDDEVLEQFVKLHEASTKIHEAFRRISEKVIIALAPALSKMSDRFSHWLDTVDVKKFIDPLVHGMEMVVKHAGQLAKLMTINSVLMKTTGSGLSANVMKLGKGAWGVGAGMLGKVGGAIGGDFGAAGKGIGGAFGGLLGKLGSVIPMVFRLVGGITGIGLVAAGIYVVIKHLDYFKEKLGGVARAIWGSVQKLWNTLGNLFSADSSIGKFVRWFGDKFFEFVKFAGSMVSKLIGMIADAIQWISDMIDSLTQHKSIDEIRNARVNSDDAAKQKETGYDKFLAPGMREQIWAITALINQNKGLSAAQQDLYRKFLESRDATYGASAGGAEGAFKSRYGAEAKAPEGSAAPGSAGVYQDFRGSRFDIEQKFAEGFDPDRIAVGFANDIASLGEKRLASNLSPVYAVR